MRQTGDRESNPSRPGHQEPVPAVGGKGPVGFPVIGICASAGGSEAVKDFFSGMAEEIDPDSAIILVQEQAPSQQSLLAEWIQPCTRMKVVEAVDGIAILRDHVYVASGGREISLRGGLLHVSGSAGQSGQRLPSDFLLGSLAAELGPKAIGIILTGCAGGAEGARAIKKAGGQVIVQSPGSAGANSLSPGAIGAGLADHELEPSEMPALLLKLLCQDEQNATTGDDSAIQSILKLLLESSGYDFTPYKQNSVRRAVVRRMGDCSIQRLEDYQAHLRKFPAELDSLFHQLLIGVTWFFRDPDAFRMLAESLSKTIMPHRPAGEVFRVWIAGCSTGEEAYSIAILLTEVREALRLNCRVQVFATDIDARAVATARAGAYASEISSLIPPDRLKSCFTALPDGGHRINKSIRDEVVFSVHSLLKDPPFSKLDLIVCRNVLIYLDAQAQNRIFSLFHASLKPSGILMLGSSESVGDQQRLFTALDRKAKIYQRRVIGHAIKTAGADGGVAGIAQPIVPGESNAGTSPPKIATPGAAEPPDLTEQPPTIAALQQELRAQELEMTRTTVKLRDSDEDRISSNEERQSMHQELESTNEELEVSQDQLQSTNEELAALNAELQAKVADLLAAKDDISNLLNCTGIGTLFLDLKRRVLRFNPLVAEILNLIPADVGLPFDRTSNHLANGSDLSAEVETVLTTLIGSEREVVTREGLSFLMRIHPYRTLDGRIEGAVISFTEITEMVHTREALEKANSHRRLAVVVHDAHDAVVMQDLEGRILAWNPGAVRMYGWSEQEALRMNRHTMVPEDLQRQELDMIEKLGRAERFDPYMTRRLTKLGKLLTVELVATSLVNDRAEVYAIATTERTTAGGVQ